MDLTVKSLPNITLVSVEAARIDAAVAIQFKEKMRGISETAAERVVLDLSTVTFLDSSGLGAVVAVMKHLDPDATLELASLNPAVAKVFRLTRLDSVFTIHADVETALGGVAQAG